MIPAKIWIMSFSAGAMTTMAVVLEGKGPTYPDFAAFIYGGMDNGTPDADAPPLFVAAAQDDKIVPSTKSAEIFQKWYGANLPWNSKKCIICGCCFALRLRRT